MRCAGDSEETALQLLDRARRVGLRRFDTANTYGGGASEIILGKWLRTQGASFRREAQIATKVGNPHGCPPGEAPLGAAQIAHHLDVSLTRLGVERIDLYYVHEFDRVTPLEEVLGAMARAVEAGKIPASASPTLRWPMCRLSCSWPASPSDRASNMCRTNTICSPRDAEALIPWCAGHGLRYTAFSPLAGGFLTGKYRFGELPPPGSRLAYAPQVCAGYSNEKAFAAIERFRQSAGERQETMAEAALRFVLDTPGFTA